MEKLSLEELKKVELDILIWFADICEQEKLNYTLSYGTLLGAVRHKGFIPWDDDIDICMTRENFERFEKIANTKLQKCFFYQSPNTDSECSSYCCGRVRLEGTHFESTSLPNNWKHSGIFIDSRQPGIIYGGINISAILKLESSMSNIDYNCCVASSRITGKEIIDYVKNNITDMAKYFIYAIFSSTSNTPTIRDVIGVYSSSSTSSDTSLNYYDSTGTNISGITIQTD